MTGNPSTDTISYKLIYGDRYYQIDDLIMNINRYLLYHWDKLTVSWAGTARIWSRIKAIDKRYRGQCMHGIKDRYQSLRKMTQHWIHRHVVQWNEVKWSASTSADTSIESVFKSDNSVMYSTYLNRNMAFFVNVLKPDSISPLIFWITYCRPFVHQPCTRKLSFVSLTSSFTYDNRQY